MVGLDVLVGTIWFSPVRRDDEALERDYVAAAWYGSTPPANTSLARGRQRVGLPIRLEDGLRDRCRDRRKHQVGLKQPDLVKALAALEAGRILWLPAF